MLYPDLNHDYYRLVPAGHFNEEFSCALDVADRQQDNGDTDVAEAMGITPEAVRQIRERAQKILKIRLGTVGIGEVMEI